MHDVAVELARLLADVRQPGDFAVAAAVPLAMPALEVEGVGRVALPILPAQARALAAVATPAPYGKGAETVLDPDVRRCRQIDAGKVRITGRRWEQGFAALLERVTEALGVEGPVAAELYKLLVYEEGGFFLDHRDTEKLPGMFATLVLALPTEFEGGALLVRHRGEEHRFDLRPEEPGEIGVAAFYADCVHAVEPVTRGHRVILTYSLLRRGRRKALPTAPDHREAVADIAALLGQWCDTPPADAASPLKLLHILEHAYTPAEIGFATLKGPDAAVARVLAAAAPAAACELHLALLTITESGIADYDDSTARRGRYGRLESDLVVGEVTDDWMGLTEWRRPDGAPSLLGELPVEADEFAPPHIVDELEPDEEEFREASGNEGASFDRTYRRAVLVLWPRNRRIRVEAAAGLSVLLPRLEAMLGAGAAARAEVLDYATALVERWEPHPVHWDDDSRAETMTPRLLRLLARLDDAALVEQAVIRAILPGHFSRRDVPAVLDALGVLPPARAAAVVTQVVTAQATERFARCARLLAEAATRLDPAALKRAARLLAGMLWETPEVAETAPRWQRGPRVEPAMLLDLIRGLDAIDPTLADRCVAQILGDPKRFPVDEVLLPVARDLAQPSRSAAAEALIGACAAHLRARIAVALEPPTDWRRDDAIACKCKDCRDLGRFLTDPGERQWMLRAAESERSHVADSIRRARSDLDQTTDRKGRPYTLVCTKTQASHERRVAQRTADLADLKRLGAAP